MAYERKCPKCGNVIEYANRSGYHKANKKQSVCPNCIGTIISEKTKIAMNNLSLEMKQRIVNANKGNKNRLGHKHTEESKKKISDNHKGFCTGPRSDCVKEKIRASNIKRYCNFNNRLKASNLSKAAWQKPDIKEKMTNAIKEAMHRPDVRKNMIESLKKTKYLGKRTDVGQLELLEKWNKLGFKFEPNYIVSNDTYLFYVDGYDKEHNIIIEYDGKYHNKPSQMKKDLIRQNKIIEMLKPKKFWRYNSINKTCKNVLQQESVG